VSDQPKSFRLRLSDFFKPTNLGNVSLLLSIVIIVSSLLAIRFAKHPYDSRLGIMYFIHELPLLPFITLLFSLIGVVLGFIGTVRNRKRIQAIIGLLINAVLSYVSIRAVFLFLFIYLLGHSGTP
jgi:hypothetical protein